MTTVDIPFDIERNLKLNQKYFDYKAKKEFQKVPAKLIIGIGLAIILLGIVLDNPVFFGLGIIMISVLGLFMLYYYLKFRSVFAKFKKELHKAKAHDTQFSFDTNGIRYKTKNTDVTFQWDIISNYIENEGDLYLFQDNKKLFNIISSTTIGKENYSKFKEILYSKLELKKQAKHLTPLR